MNVSADVIDHYCLVRDWIDETRLSKSPTVDPIRVEGLQPFARVKGMQVKSHHREESYGKSPEVVPDGKKNILCNTSTRRLRGRVDQSLQMSSIATSQNEIGSWWWPSGVHRGGKLQGNLISRPWATTVLRPEVVPRQR